jgi:hydrogenase/urease accessory protein HupE
MSEFQLYFTLGLEHILDIYGFDHILFVVALCVMYSFSHWRRVLILITAFTIGHSVTLALATFKIFEINSALIEFLIPVTILITAISNIMFRLKPETSNFGRLNYLIALFFGFIHGMGFSNYLQSLLGSSSSIVQQLFAFNIGLEAGQIIIVGLFLGLAFITISFVKIDRKDWITIISSIIIGISLMLMAETKFW